MSATSDLLGSVVGVVSAKFFKLPELAAVLRGDSEPTAQMLKLASFAKQVYENDLTRDAVLPLVRNVIAEQGGDPDSVFAKLRKWGPMIGVTVEDDSDEALTKAFYSAAKGVLERSDLPVVTAIVVCPKCNFPHVV